MTDRNPDAVADTIALLASEPGLRRQLLRRREESLSRFAPAKLQKQLLDYLRRLGVQLPALPAAPAATADTDAFWRVEGPIQGSYSLAFVNRGVARGLAREGLHVASNIDKTKDLSTTKKNQVLGYSYFLRAYAYYHILMNQGRLL